MDNGSKEKCNNSKLYCLYKKKKKEKFNSQHKNSYVTMFNLFTFCANQSL